MRRTALTGLVLLCSACAPNGGGDSAPRPEPLPRQTGVGVLAQTARGRCTSIVYGPVVRRVCLPARPQPADTAALDTTRTGGEASRAGSAGGR